MIAGKGRTPWTTGKIGTGSRRRLQTGLPPSLSCIATSGPATILAAVKTAIRTDKK
jgi:hypothetical protein